MESMERLNERVLRETIAREAPTLGSAERAEALRVAKAAYQGNVTCISAVEAGINYVKDRRENG